MLKPMPSPNGTNFERLFVRDNPANPVAAYDAVGGLLTDESLQTVLEILAEANLEPDLLARLTDLFQTNSAMALDGRPRRAREAGNRSGDDDRAAWKAHAARIGQCW